MFQERSSSDRAICWKRQMHVLWKLDEQKLLDRLSRPTASPGNAVDESV
jgi:hypothetical protein